MDPTELERFLRNYERIIDSGSSLSEADTRNMIINPFLMALGWNFIPDEIQSEYPVKVGTRIQHADYCLKIDKTPVAFLEAKPLGSAIDEDSLAQVLAYGRVSFVRWCMITNGLEFIVADSQVRGKSPADSEVFRFRYDEIKDTLHYLEAISPEGLGSDLIASLADEISKRKALLTRFAESRSVLRERILDLVSEFCPDTTLAEGAAERFLNQLKATLESGREGGGDGKRVFPRLSRVDLSGESDDLVAVFPSRPEGEQFIQEWNAWGFVAIKKRPKYCAIYFTKPEHRIRLVASVSRIVKASEWIESRRDRISERVMGFYDPSKFVIEFRPEGIWELEDPIPWRPGDPVPFGLRYTTLGVLRTATRLGELRASR